MNFGIVLGSMIPAAAFGAAAAGSRAIIRVDAARSMANTIVIVCFFLFKISPLLWVGRYRITPL